MQSVFNSPPGLSDAMDLAKMLAVLEMIAGLEGPDFRIWRQTRTGLLSYPVDLDAARAHLAANVYLQMALKPHIVHVVGYTEADHAATAAELIESCKLARRVFENALHGLPDPTKDPIVQARKEELVQETQVTLDAIRALAPASVADPLADAVTLSQAVQRGILDAPQLANNPYGRGEVVTRIDARRACIAVDPKTNLPIDETTRLSALVP